MSASSLFAWLNARISGRYLDGLFVQLGDEFEFALGRATTLPDPDRNYAIAICRDILDRHRNRRSSLDDVRRFQWALIHLYDDMSLRSKVMGFIGDYRVLADLEPTQDDELILEVKAAATSGPAESTGRLRSALLELIAESNQISLARSEKWQQRAELSLISIAWLLLSFTVFLFTVRYFSAIYQIFWIGVIGGVVSTQQRIIFADASTARWVRGFINLLPYINVGISPVFGGVGAILLFSFLQSGILETLGITSGIFPHFANLCDSSGPVNCFLDNVPAEPSGVALLFLYCFLGGFSERLVPDLLDRLSRNLDGQIKI